MLREADTCLGSLSKEVEDLSEDISELKRAFWGTPCLTEVQTPEVTETMVQRLYSVEFPVLSYVSLGIFFRFPRNELGSVCHTWRCSSSGGTQCLAVALVTTWATLSQVAFLQVLDKSGSGFI